MTTRARILYPDSTAPLADKYALAWGLLLRHEDFTDATEGERAHAKCWLTYRAAEGVVSYAHWAEKINPQSIDFDQLTAAEKARWTVSLLTAEIILTILHPQAEQPQWRDIAASLVMAKQYLADWPPCVLSFTRLYALIAYKAWLHADDRDAWAVPAATAWREWQGVMSSVNYAQFPWRAMEARDDVIALHVLSLIAHKAGKLSEDVPECFSVERLFSAQSARAVPFIAALRKLSEGAEPERVIFGEVQTPFTAPRHPVKFTFALSAEQKALWKCVQAAGVTHIPMAASTNLGDDIQAVAAHHVCGLRTTGEHVLARDEPSTWPAGATVLLCGWYGGPFLPADDVRVIVCGFHLHPKHIEDGTFASLGLFEQLAQRVAAQGFPAGCRDLHTVRVLTERGIPAVWSGCVSSMLPACPTVERTKRLVIDGPSCKGREHDTHRLETLRSATILQRLQQAEIQLKRLASCASLVTSRLHAALPALAQGCPEVILCLDDVPNPERWDGFITSETAEPTTL